MRETRADTQRAVVDALGLHVLLFVLVFVGLWWTRTANPVSAAGPVIEADLVDPDALAAPLRRALEAPAESVPEPVAEPAPAPPAPEESIPPPEAKTQPQEVIPDPALVEQERVEREAEAARQAAREQEEKRRQEQIDLTERKRQQEAERKRLAEEQAREARKKAIADKLEKVRAAQKKAARDAELAEQKLRQIEDASSRNAAEAAAQADADASPPPGTGGPSNDLMARYRAALQAAIRRNWTRPENIPPGQRCLIIIHQLPGGEVLDAKVDPSCPYDDHGRRQVEAAVLKAQPLPYAGFEAVFERTLRLTFIAD